jgi:hypothetical protein
MKKPCEFATRTKIGAFRAGPYVLLIAEGELPNPGFDVDIAQSPLKIFPPQFNLVRCQRPGPAPEVVTPYRYAEPVRFPENQRQITVHHADGADEIDIEDCGDELSGFVRAVHGDADRRCPEGTDEAVGFSTALRFDDAFADALAKLPPSDAPLADALARVEVLEIGGLFGGFAGFHHLFVRLARTIT